MMTPKPCTHGVVAVTFSSSEQFNGKKTVRQCRTRHRFWIASHSNRCPVLERNCTRHSEKNSVGKGTDGHLCSFCFPVREVSGRVSCTRFGNLVILGNTGHPSLQSRVIGSFGMRYRKRAAYLRCGATFLLLPCLKETLKPASGCSGPAVPTVGCWSGPIPVGPSSHPSVSDFQLLIPGSCI